MKSGTTDVCLQIVQSGPPIPFGSGTSGRGLASLSGIGGAFHFARGDGERLCVTPPTKPSLGGTFGAPLEAASFHRCIAPFDISSDGSVCVPTAKSSL